MLETNIYVLGILVTFVVVIAFRFSQLIEQGNICVFYSVYKHISTNIPIYNDLYLYWAKHGLIITFQILINVLQLYHSSPLSLLICNFPFQQWETWLHCLWYIYFVVQFLYMCMVVSVNLYSLGLTLPTRV